MSNRGLRFVIALLAIGAAGGAGYRIFQHERQLAGATASTRAGAYAAESAITTLSEIRASLHAYVVPGQGHDFWIARAEMLIDKLRGSFTELDRAASSSGLALTDELDLSDRIAAAEKRARTHLKAGQMLLAGEVIFTEARDLLDAMGIGIAGTRDALIEAADRKNTEIRREQVLLALGAAAVMVMAVLVLVPPGRVAAPLAPESSTASASARESSNASSGETAQKRPAGREGEQVARPKVRVGSITASTADAPPAPAAPIASASDREPLDASYDETSPKQPVGLEGWPGALGFPLTEAAAVCTDLGRVSQSNEISALLGRAASVLSASGVIVWVASENRDELFAAAASGYDQRLFERIGSISRDASNLTAAAFRGGSPRTSAGRGGSPAALAVPLLTPQGPVGVFAAELREVSEIDPARLALAAIFAAQLASLLGSIGANVETAGEPQAQNG